MLPIAGESNAIDVFFLVGVPLLLVIGGYILLRRRNIIARRIGGTCISSIATLFAVCAIIAYVLPVFEDFRNPSVPLWSAILGLLVIWTICLGALVLAFRVVWHGFGKAASIDQEK